MTLVKVTLSCLKKKKDIGQQGYPLLYMPVELIGSKSSVSEQSISKTAN